MAHRRPPRRPCARCTARCRTTRRTSSRSTARGRAGCGWCRRPGSGELTGLQLLPAHQGKGLGTHLVEQFLVDAREQGLPARVDVQRDNPQARAFYEGLGFVEVGAVEAPDTLADGDVRMEWRR